MYQSLNQVERYHRPPQSDQLDNPEILYFDIRDVEWVADEDLSSWSGKWDRNKGYNLVAINGIDCVGFIIFNGANILAIDIRPGYESIRSELISQAGFLL